MAGRIRNRLKRLRNKFGKLHCPVCDQSVAYFLPIPDEYLASRQASGTELRLEDYETLNHANYSCPLCGASDRERLYALYLAGKLAAGEGAALDVLDIAPSQSLQRFLKNRSGVVYRSADLYRDDVDDQVDIQNMHCYEDARFDLFICSHVLEHVADDVQAMSELRRVLKPAGFGILMVPINLSRAAIDEDAEIADPAEQLRRFGQDDHVRVYSKQGFIERARRAGLEVTLLGADEFGAARFEQCGITPQSVLYEVRQAA